MRGSGRELPRERKGKEMARQQVRLLSPGRPVGPTPLGYSRFDDVLFQVFLHDRSFLLDHSIMKYHMENSAVSVQQMSQLDMFDGLSNRQRTRHSASLMCHLFHLPCHFPASIHAFGHLYSHCRLQSPTIQRSPQSLTFSPQCLPSCHVPSLQILVFEILLCSCQQGEGEVVPEEHPLRAVATFCDSASGQVLQPVSHLFFSVIHECTSSVSLGGIWSWCPQPPKLRINHLVSTSLPFLFLLPPVAHSLRCKLLAHLSTPLQRLDTE